MYRFQYRDLGSTNTLLCSDLDPLWGECASLEVILNYFVNSKSSALGR